MDTHVAVLVLASPSPLAGLLPELKHARCFADASTAPAMRTAYARMGELHRLVLIQIARCAAGAAGDNRRVPLRPRRGLDDPPRRSPACAPHGRRDRSHPRGHPRPA